MVPLSDEVRMVPDSPTETYNFVVIVVLPVVVVVLSIVVVVLSVVVELSLLLDVLLIQEMMVRLKRNNERMMSRCFTWVPN